MRRPLTALQQVMRDCGYSIRVCAHIEGVLDLLSEPNAHSDELAARLLRWRQQAWDEGFRRGEQAGSDFLALREALCEASPLDDDEDGR